MPTQPLNTGILNVLLSLNQADRDTYINTLTKDWSAPDFAKAIKYIYGRKALSQKGSEKESDLKSLLHDFKDRI